MKLLLVNLIQENSFENNNIIVTDQLIKSITTDNLAFRDLYEATHKSIYGFAYSIVKNPYDAKDVVQETYIKIYKSVDKYVGQNKPLAWMYTIARNIALEMIRKKQKTVYTEDHEGLENQFLVQPDTSYESTYILQKALSKLNETDKQIVVLHALSGLKHKEISEILNLNLSTVISKYNRALVKLQKIIREDDNA